MKKGKLIALSGVDGSGKTTQTDLIYKYFHNAGNSVIVIKTFEYFLLSPILSLVKSLGSNHAKFNSNVHNNTKPIIKLWCIPALIDFWVIHLFKIRALRKHDVVISDRYFLDMAVTMRVSGYMPDCVFKTYIKLIPKADIQIIISLDHKLSLKRSKEFNMDYHKLQHRLYSEAAKTLSSKLIDGTSNRETVTKNIILNAKQ